MAGVLKRTTGLTGLKVVQNPHRVLGILYGKILRTLEKMPETAAYKKYTSQIITERAAVLKQNQSVSEVERLIGCGQIEELITQAENELVLSRKMLGWKPWESLAVHPPKGQWDWPPTK